MTKRLCDKEIAEYLEELWREAYAADDYSQIWRALNDDTRKYVSVWEKHATFFDLSLTAHFAVAVMALCKIHETKSGKSINALINNLPPSQAAAKEIIEKKLGSEKPRIENLYNLRSKFFAHRMLNGEEAFNRYKVKPADIESTIKTTLGLLDLLSRAFGKGSFETDDLQAEKATIHLLDALNTHL